LTGGTCVFSPPIQTSQPSPPSVTTRPCTLREISAQAPAGALAQHLAFVVVHRDPGRLLDEGGQLAAVEHRQALARVEHEGDAGRLELLGVLQHRVAAVGRDDAQLDVGARGDAGDVRLHHRAGVEGRDLVVVQVGHDHRLRRVGVLELAHELGADAQLRRRSR
jgi:hypothetical protein